MIKYLNPTNSAQPEIKRNETGQAELNIETDAHWRIHCDFRPKLTQKKLWLRRKLKRKIVFFDRREHCRSELFLKICLYEKFESDFEHVSMGVVLSSRKNNLSVRTLTHHAVQSYPVLRPSSYAQRLILKSLLTNCHSFKFPGASSDSNPWPWDDGASVVPLCYRQWQQ